MSILPRATDWHKGSFAIFRQTIINYLRASSFPPSFRGCGIHIHRDYFSFLWCFLSKYKIRVIRLCLCHHWILWFLDSFCTVKPDLWNHHVYSLGAIWIMVEQHFGGNTSN
jgi:hypothetical protein